MYHMVVEVIVIKLNHKQGGKRRYQQTCHKVSDAVHYIPRYSRYYPRQSLLEVKTEHKRLGGRIQSSVSKTVKSAHHRINYSGSLRRYTSWYQHSQRPKESPYVKIRDPPHIKSCVKPLQKYVQVYGYQCLDTKYDRKEYRKHSEQVNVGQKLHYQLGYKHHGRKHGKKHRLEYGVTDTPRISLTLCRQICSSPRLKCLLHRLRPSYTHLPDKIPSKPDPHSSRP